MAILKGARHAWASVFCPGCKCIVQYQNEDVIESEERKVTHTELGPRRSGSIQSVFSIICTCETRIEVARLR